MHLSNRRLKWLVGTEGGRAVLRVVLVVALVALFGAPVARGIAQAVGVFGEAVAAVAPTPFASLWSSRPRPDLR